MASTSDPVVGAEVGSVSALDRKTAVMGDVIVWSLSLPVWVLPFVLLCASMFVDDLRLGFYSYASAPPLTKFLMFQPQWMWVVIPFANAVALRWVMALSRRPAVTVAAAVVAAGIAVGMLCLFLAGIMLPLYANDVRGA